MSASKSRARGVDVGALKIASRVLKSGRRAGDQSEMVLHQAGQVHSASGSDITSVIIKSVNRKNKFKTDNFKVQKKKWRYFKQTGFSETFGVPMS